MFFHCALWLARLSLLVLPGTLEYQATRGVNYGAWARVRCKGCPYTGIGLQVNKSSNIQKQRLTFGPRRVGRTWSGTTLATRGSSTSTSSAGPSSSSSLAR